MGNILSSPIKGLSTDTRETPLLKENYLSEFSTEDEKSVARANLGVNSSDESYTKEEAEEMVSEKMKEKLEGYVTTGKLSLAIAALNNKITSSGYVKSDGSIPFTSAQSQTVDPTDDSHLANKKYVDDSLTSHVKEDDPHGTLEKVEDILKDYAKSSDVYTKAKTYSKRDIDSLLSSYVKSDGSVPFTEPQVGVDPVLPKHLATLRTARLIMQEHRNEVDPHGFVAMLIKYLGNYYTKSETYTKAQTYSRIQIQDILKEQFGDLYSKVIDELGDLKEYTMKELAEVIHADGSVAHYVPQVGVAAVHSNEFVTLGQVNSIIGDVITQKPNVWVPTGPVQSTVGFVEDNTTMPREMTLQQVCDAIFYGKQTELVAPGYAEIGSEVCLTISVHGLGLLNEVHIYKDDVEIGILYPSDFTVDSELGVYYEFCDTGSFTEDATWKAEFIYSNGETITSTAITKIAYPMFIGAIPYWWNSGEDITISSLKQLAKEDPDNCEMIIGEGGNISMVAHDFNFTDVRLRSIAIVIPNDYPDLTKAVSSTQTVTSEAFAKWIQPLYPDGATSGILYKIYIFNQPLVKLSDVIEFYFD